MDRQKATAAGASTPSGRLARNTNRQLSADSGSFRDSNRVSGYRPRRQHPVLGALILSLIFAGFWVGVFALIGVVSAHPLALDMADLAVVVLVLVGCVWALIVSWWH